MNNNIGIFNWFGYVMSIDKRLEIIKKTGFDKVMLWWEDEDYPYLTKRQDLIKKVKKYDLGLDSIHLPSTDNNALWSDSNSERLSYLDNVLRWMYECKKAGAEILVSHITDDDKLTFKKSNGYKSFEKIISFAEEIDIKLSAENTKMNEYLEFILDEFDSKNLGICYDSSHDFVQGQSKGRLLNKYKDRLFCVHLSDNDFTCDRHWLPGNGDIDYTDIVKIIKESKCNCFSMEVYPFGEEKALTPEEFLLKAKKSIENIIY